MIYPCNNAGFARLDKCKITYKKVQRNYIIYKGVNDIIIVITYRHLSSTSTVPTHRKNSMEPYRQPELQNIWKRGYVTFCLRSREIPERVLNEESQIHNTYNISANLKPASTMARIKAKLAIPSRDGLSVFSSTSSIDHIEPLGVVRKPRRYAVKELGLVAERESGWQWLKRDEENWKLSYEGQSLLSLLIRRPERVLCFQERNTLRRANPADALLWMCRVSGEPS